MISVNVSLVFHLKFIYMLTTVLRDPSKFDISWKWMFSKLERSQKFETSEDTSPGNKCSM